MPNREEDSSLFVYGTLLDESHRREILGRAVHAIPARLVGYERRRDRHFYVVKRAGQETPGLVLLGLGTSDFETLDRYEEIPRLYTRERVEVISANGGAVRCWIYLPTSHLLDGSG